MFGLKESELLALPQIPAFYPEIREACMFGSHVKGNYKNGSDIDTVVKGNNISYNLILSISTFRNEETLMAYR